MKTITLSQKDIEIAKYYLDHLDCTMKDIAKHFKVSTARIEIVMRTYMDSKRNTIEWDPHELEGELNPAHDFRNLIRYV